MENLKVGISGTATVTVTEHNTAKAMRSGSLPVFATPSMTALMEEAACRAVGDKLASGMGTVGISLQITHDAPSALGAVITATAELIAVDGRKLTFKVSAHDETKLIGKGIHERFIIDNAKFMSKL